MILLLYHKIPINVGISMILDIKKALGLVRGLGLCLQSGINLSFYMRRFFGTFQSVKSKKKFTLIVKISLLSKLPNG